MKGLLVLTLALLPTLANAGQITLILSDEIEDEAEVLVKEDLSDGDDLYLLPPDDLLPTPPPSSRRIRMPSAASSSMARWPQ